MRWPSHFQGAVDGASLVVFRIAFGLLLLIEVGRYYFLNGIRDYYITPVFHFTYPGFEWVRPWPGTGMYWHFAGLAIASGCVVLGRCYRPALVCLAFGWTYVLLLEQTAYLNHLYLICLICWVMCLLPKCSLGILPDHSRYNQTNGLEVHTTTMPAVYLWLLRAQIAIPYFFGGIVKINSDWLHGQPLQLWMQRMHHVRAWIPFYGDWWLAIVMSYAGLLIDLFIVPALLWPRTRKWAYGIAVVFHVLNSVMFQIGIFPWFMIAATTLFLAPDWPRAALRRFCGIESNLLHPQANPIGIPKWFGGVALVWFTIQIILPFRHWLYAGNVDWTEEGSKFAWRMMLHDKWAAVSITLVDPLTKKTRSLNPGAFLSQRQVDKMCYDPELLRVFSHHVAAVAAEGGLGKQEVHVVVRCSLNGRTPQLLVDPQIDLASEPYRWSHQTWISDLTEPLPEISWTPERLLRNVGEMPIPSSP